MIVLTGHHQEAMQLGHTMIGGAATKEGAMAMDGLREDMIGAAMALNMKGAMTEAYLLLLTGEVFTHEL